MIEGLIHQGLKSLGLKNVPVIITGGYANWLLPLFTMKVIHDPHLSLKGIALCN
jgi:pantothenate kinase type III